MHYGDFVTLTALIWQQGFIEKEPSEESKKNFKSFFKYLAIFTNTALCCSFILLLIAFTCGESDKTTTGKQVGKYCNESSCQSGGCQCGSSGGTCNPDKCTSNNCPCCKDKGGTISSVNAFLSQGLMIVLAFTGDGYLKTYSKYEHDRDKWPTKDCGFFKSLGYWTRSRIT